MGIISSFIVAERTIGIVVFIVLPHGVHDHIGTVWREGSGGTEHKSRLLYSSVVGRFRGQPDYAHGILGIFLMFRYVRMAASFALRLSLGRSP